MDPQQSPLIKYNTSRQKVTKSLQEQQRQKRESELKKMDDLKSEENVSSDENGDEEAEADLVQEFVISSDEEDDE